LYFSICLTQTSIIYQENGIIYSLSIDFNFTGGLASVLKTHWKTVRRERPEFGSRSNRHVITEEQDQAVRDGIMAGLLDLDNLDDLQLVLNWLMSKYFLQRGIKERTELHWSRFAFFTYDVRGPLHGNPAVELVRGFDKTCPLSLSNPSVKTSAARLVYVHNVNDPLSLYTLLRKYRDMCPPAQKNFYCYAKSGVAIDRERRAGATVFVSNPNKPKGHNQIMGLGQEIARRVGVPGWAKCTNHSWRAFGITRMSNSSSVSITEAMGAARHTSAAAHQAYVRTSGASETSRIMAISDVGY
jgi:hypothetical protein